MKPSIWEQRFMPRSDSRDGDHRSAAQRDKARVMHSAAFRRLQAKTQIHGIGISDFYRTRLTHSLEAAQIGSGITEQINSKFPKQAKLLNLDSQLIETLCLAHDIGHPAFGHGGEIALNYMMRNDGGFEGNAQTFRIVTQLEPYTKENGMNLSRRTLLGLVKYPQFLDTLVTPYPTCHASTIREINANHYIPPKGLYRCDQTVFDWLLTGIDDDDAEKFMLFQPGQSGHQTTLYKSFDCSIMELADDIAYGIHDLEDAIKLNKVNILQFQNLVVKPIQEHGTTKLSDRIYTLSIELFSEESYRRKNAIGAIVNNFITAIEVFKQEQFKTNILDYQARLSTANLHDLSLFKSFVREHVINTTDVQIAEFRGQQIVMELMQAFTSDPVRLLPKNAYRRWQAVDDSKMQRRIIADYVAGMTDEFAMKMHQNLFSS